MATTCRTFWRIAPGTAGWWRSFARLATPAPARSCPAALGAIAEPSVLLLADDDVRYRHDFVTRFAPAHDAAPPCTYSSYTYRCGGLTIDQGCDGFGLWTPQLTGALAFFDRHIAGTRFVFHDDLWISFFLTLRDIAVVIIPAEGGRCYERVHELGTLSGLGGALGRDLLTREGIDYLIDNAIMPPVSARGCESAVIGDGS